jgi:uncharacterized membrane-anchored protein YhcB (DUF1043 family)
MHLDSGIAAVLAALISGFVALITVVLRLRQENRQDHAIVANALDRLADGINDVREKLDDHIIDHREGHH